MPDEAHMARVAAAIRKKGLHLDILRFYRDRLHGLGDRIVLLDLGAGSGEVSTDLAEDVNISRIVAYDQNDEMMRKLVPSEKITKETSGTHVALPFETGDFDAVVCRNALHHFERPRKAIAEMARVLRPGGLLLLSDVVLPEHSARALNPLCRVREDNFFGFVTYHELLSFVEDSGLQPILMRPYWAAVYDEFAQYLGGVDSGFDEASQPADDSTARILKRKITRAWDLLDDRTRQEMRITGSGETLLFEYPMLDLAARRPG